MAIYSNTNLLSDLSRRAFVPDTQTTFSNTDLLAMADTELQSVLIPMIIKHQEEYYVTSEEFQVTSSQRSFDIPERAINSILRDVTFVLNNSSSNEYSLSQFSIEDLQESSDIVGFYLKGNKIIITGSETGTLKLYYYERPNALVEVSRAAQVVAIDPITKTISLSSLPSVFSTSLLVDGIKSRAGYDTLMRGNQIVSISGADITLQDDIPNELAVGDWISLEQTSPVPQIPTEYRNYLIWLVAAQVHNGLGDHESMVKAMEMANKTESGLATLTSGRVHGEPKRIVSPRNRGYRWLYKRRY